MQRSQGQGLPFDHPPNPNSRGFDGSQQESPNLEPSDSDVSPLDTNDDSRTNSVSALDSDSQRSTKIKPKTDQGYDWTGSWTWEIAGAIFSAVSIGLLMGFLGYVNGMTYASWQYSISPNAVISIISAFAKASMLVAVSSCLGQLKWNETRESRSKPQPLYHFQVLDDASRGPWGSLSLFWKIKSPLAIMGAALTVLSVALDPFAQQILLFPSRDVVAHNETAFIQRMENFNSSWNSKAQQAENVLDPKLQTALLTGLAQINTPLAPVCSTASCDYPDFATLGICSSCQDVTASSTQSCQPIDFNSSGKIDYIHMINKSAPLRSAHANCSYTSPSKLVLAPEIEMVQVSFTKPRLELDRESFTSTSRRDHLTIGSIFMATYDDTPVIYTEHNLTAAETRPKMTECSLDLCERLYTQNQVSTKNRTLQVSKSQPMISVTPDYRDIIYLAPKDSPGTFSPNSNYSIDQPTWALLFRITSYFNTTLFTSSPSEGDSGVRLGPILFNSDNITESILRMADSMTDTMRSSPGALQVPGRAFQTETYIHVRWLWIMLPLALIVFSIVLLAMMVLASRGQPVMWKSAILPLIMGRLETAPEHDHIACLRRMDEVQSLSRNMRVVVREEDKSLVFSEQ